MEGKGRGVFSTNLSRKVISSVSTLESSSPFGKLKKRGTVLCKSLSWMFHVLLHVQDEEAMVGISAMYHLHAGTSFFFPVWMQHMTMADWVDWSITAAGPPMLKLQ